MIKVLIVDDDKLARKGLIAIMDWGKYGFEVAGDVQNGRKALAFLQDHPVDIIFTDIDMPEIDGIELMKLCEEAYPDVKFVIFSVYEDFHYAQTAIRMGAKYIQTTRESILDVEYLLFTEAHSHASEQKLVKDDLDGIIDEIDRIIFIEDEVTTGNTILNIVNILNELYGRRIRFSVASILNSMTEKQMKEYEQKGINVHYLLKTDHRNYSETAEGYHENGLYEPCNINEISDVEEVCLTGRLDARRLVDAAEYKGACESLWRRVDAVFNPRADEKILVVGTEEFMFPALYIGASMEDKGCAVRCHSTTRSPIAVSSDEGYPLRTRYEFGQGYVYL